MPGIRNPRRGVQNPTLSWIPLHVAISLFTVRNITAISIYPLSDLGDLSNLIGSLSRTIQQYSPSEWIMCELSVFPIF